MASNTAVSTVSALHCSYIALWNKNRFYQIFSGGKITRYALEVQLKNPLRRKTVLVGEKLKHLIKSTTASVNSNLSAGCVTEFSHSIKHALLQSCHLEGKHFFLCCHVCRMPHYSASQWTIISLKNWAPSNEKWNWAKCMTSITD